MTKEAKEVCSVCHGSGVIRAGSEEDGWQSAECDYCDGTGKEPNGWGETGYLPDANKPGLFG